MTKITKVTLTFLLLYGISLATIFRVPEVYPPPDGIQNAIDAADSGDTVSIRSDPPYAETTNISFKGKNILVANRGYIDPRIRETEECAGERKSQGILYPHEQVAAGFSLRQRR